MNDRPEQLEARLAELEQENQRLSQILSRLPDVFYRTDAQGFIVEAEGDLAHHLGYSADEMLGRKLSEFYVHEGDRDKILAALVAAKGEVVNVLSELRHREGHSVWASTDARLLLDETGAVLGVEGITRNTTKEYQMQVALEAAKDQAEEMSQRAQEANEAKSRFLADMSHDLRTPLTGILGALDLLKRSALQESEMKFVEIAHSSSRGLLSLIDDLLNLARLESGKIEINEQAFSLTSLMTEIADPIKIVCEQKNLFFVLSADIDPALDWIESDADRIRQVIQNLLSNAVNHTEQGQIDLALTVGVTSAGLRHVSISVVDTGKGIPADKLADIFERFKQAGKNTGQPGSGTGLGLAIASGIAELLEGKINVESTLGEGSRFEFQFEVEAAHSPWVPNEAEVNGTSLAGISVLVVDDNEINQKVAAGFLAQWQIDFVTVYSGEAALELLTRRGDDFDLILLDIRMPGIGGVDVAKRIRHSNEAWKDIPILAFTANLFAHQIETYLEAGMNGYVAKPFDGEDLKSAIVNALNETDVTSDASVEAPLKVS